MKWKQVNTFTASSVVESTVIMLANVTGKKLTFPYFI